MQGLQWPLRLVNITDGLYNLGDMGEKFGVGVGVDQLESGRRGLQL